MKFVGRIGSAFDDPSLLALYSLGELVVPDALFRRGGQL
jgi:hypothetical protein